MNFDYQKKALKYKAKYLELKKQYERLNILEGGMIPELYTQFERLNILEGGMIPEWYTQFETELREIFSAVSNHYPQVVLTGSGAIAYVLSQLGMYNGFENFKPGDLDFLYKSKFGEHNPQMIMEYKIKPGQESETSVTFILDKPLPKYIKSFDVSKTNPNIKTFNLNGIEIVDLNRLKLDYKPSFETPEERVEKDKRKMELIDKIIQHIGKEGRLHEFGLDDNVTVRDAKRKNKTLFGDDDDDTYNTDNTDNFMARNFSSRFDDFDSPKKSKPSESKESSGTKRSNGLFGYESESDN
jgi:hypothetical protein